MWLSGRRLDPTFTYTLLAEDPLVLRDEVRYRTRSGASRVIAGVDRFSGGRFVWRGSGLLRPLSSRWRVVHVSDDRDLVVLTFDKSLVTPAGMDVIVRGNAGRSSMPGNLPGADALHWL
jgi:hypothetical protein